MNEPEARRGSKNHARETSHLWKECAWLWRTKREGVLWKEEYFPMELPHKFYIRKLCNIAFHLLWRSSGCPWRQAKRHLRLKDKCGLPWYRVAIEKWVSIQTDNDFAMVRLYRSPYPWGEPGVEVQSAGRKVNVTRHTPPFFQKGQDMNIPLLHHMHPERLAAKSKLLMAMEDLTIETVTESIPECSVPFWKQVCSWITEKLSWKLW